ncbi:hypothetical protein ACWGIU_38315, partial [Streptomyces sp. NPDC054840]
SCLRGRRRPGRAVRRCVPGGCGPQTTSGGGLARIGPALSVAVDARRAERHPAGMAEAAALLPADAGRTVEAVRALTAGPDWRAGHPRPVGERHGGRPPGADPGPARPERHREEEARATLTPAAFATTLTTAPRGD